MHFCWGSLLLLIPFNYYWVTEVSVKVFYSVNHSVGKNSFTAKTENSSRL